MECTQERLKNIILKIPYLISKDDTNKLLNVNSQLGNLIINVGLWGLFPFVIGFVLLIILLLYLCYAKGSKEMGMCRKVISLTVLIGVTVLLVCSAVFVLEVKKQNDKLQQSYISFVMKIEEIIESTNETSGSLDNQIIQLKKNISDISESNDYKQLLKVIDNDVLGDVIDSLDDTENPIAKIQDSLSTFKLSQYEETRKRVESTINKYIIPTLISIYSIGAFFSVILMTYLFSKKGGCIKFCPGILIFLALIYLILAIVLLGVPMILSVACDQIKPFVKNLDIPYVADIIDCDLQKPNPIIENISNINIVINSPQMNNCPDHKFLSDICSRINSKLQNLNNEVTQFVDQIKKDITTNLNIVFDCDQLPQRISELKCMVCTEFAKSLFQVGFLSSMGSFLILLFMFNIPTLRKVEN